ncbi:UvrB/UvrC motif-containing protein [Crocinitomicaceae bacterium]|nr:UvrB/UvrC motif-containing protein [Crocinitomicaceae bacterium]
MKRSMSFDRIIEKIDVSHEVKCLLQEGLNRAGGDWVLFLDTLMETLVEEEDYETAAYVRDLINKMKRIKS